VDDWRSMCFGFLLAVGQVRHRLESRDRRRRTG